MHPILLNLGFIKLHTYGVMIAVGFLVALAWIQYRSNREHVSVGKMLDLAFLMMVSAIVGSRVLFIIVEWRYFLKNPLDVVKIWEGGLVFLGGLIACVLAAIFFMRKHGLNFWKVADIFMPGVALGHALGRIGCFAAGCCYGRVCDLHAWYAVVFPRNPDSLALAGLPLYPTQLIESGSEFLTFIFLALMSRKKAFDGQIFLLYLIIYSALRILFETLRGDAERGFIIEGVLSTSGFISGVVILLALGLFIYRRGRRS